MLRRVRGSATEGGSGASSLGPKPLNTASLDAALFALLYGGGLRIAEALGLSAGARDGDTLRVRGKGDKIREIPLLAAVKEAGRRYERALEGDPAARRFRDLSDVPPLFLRAKGGRLSAGVAQRRMRARRAALGLPDTATPHALRHAFATHLLAGGADLRVIQELMGHASLSSTQVYTDVDAGRLLSIHAGAHPRARRPAVGAQSASSA